MVGDHAGVLTISAMSPFEAGIALEWAAREGWNPGPGDAACFRAADPQGFLAGRLAERMVASISAVRYGHDYSFIGLYIVDPALRGRGLGSQLWHAAMTRLSGRTIGLDGVVAMQPVYARSGFVLAHRNVRYVGALPGLAATRAVAEIGARHLAAVCDYDEPCFGGPRREFLAGWLAQPGGIALGVADGTRLRGYGVLRPARTGFKIGPLFADDADVAGGIMRALAGRVGPAAEVVIDVPAANPEAVAVAEALGMAPAFETARMYAGADPGLAIDRVFGVTSFELG